MKTNEQGRSMVEMLGVLAIIGVLSAGGLAGYSKAMFKHKLNSTMDQITMLVTNIRTMYGTQGNYNKLATDAINLGIIPSVMGTAMNALTNPFKGGVTIAEISATTGEAVAEGANSTGFTLKYAGLPKEACISLATADFGSGAGSGFIGVSATDGTATKKTATKIGGTEGTYTEGTALSMTDAISACQGETNEVTWYFY